MAPTGDLQKAGDTVTFTLVAHNTGNTTLTDVAFQDAFPGLSTLDIQWPDVEGALAPDASATATATYQLLQADVDRGSVENTATATAVGPGDVPVDDEDTVTISVPAVGKISLAKAGTLAASATGVPGDLVTWTFTVENTGPTTLSDIAISDTYTGLSTIRYGDWSTTDGQLAPGESVTATATSALTSADISAGYVENHATVAGVQFDETQLTSQDTARVDIPRVPVAGQDPIGTIVQLAHTGSTLPIALGAVAIVLLAAGLVLIVRRRRTAE